MATTSSTAPSAAAAGRRILGEIEETSLEDVLRRIRTEVKARRVEAAAVAAAAETVPGGFHTPAKAITQPGTVPSGHPSTSGHYQKRPLLIPIPALEQLTARHFHATRSLELSIGGTNPLPLLYLLVATLVAAPRRQTVIVVDLEARFDASQLEGMVGVVLDPEGGEDAPGRDTEKPKEHPFPVTKDDLQHVHVFRVDPRWRAPLSEIVAAAEQRVLYGAHRRRDRAWWGTLVVGGAGLGGGSAASTGQGGSGSMLSHGVGSAVVTGYYGWLRVAAQGVDPVTKQQQQKAKLNAMLDGDDDDDETEEDETGSDDIPGGGSSATTTWVASSPWGSFAFKLLKAPP